MKTTLLICSLLSFVNLQFTEAQDSKKVKTKFEEIQEKCVNLPLDQRVRMVVARFNISTPSATQELGENMGTMLTNALTEINCFRMLEMLKNADDWKGELDYGKNQNKERNNRAQIVVNGEITEFTKQIKTGGALMVKSNKEIVKLGFIIKLINPETRDILFSKSINVEGKANGGTSAVLFRNFAGGINLGSGENKNAAIANALEQGIMQAAEFIGDKKDQLHLPEAGSKTSTSTMISEVQVTNTDYERMSGLETKMRGLDCVKSVEANLTDDSAQLIVEHTGTLKEFIDKLKAASGNTFDIKGMDTGNSKAKLQMK